MSNGGLTQMRVAQTASECLSADHPWMIVLYVILVVLVGLIALCLMFCDHDCGWL